MQNSCTVRRKQFKKIIRLVVINPQRGLELIDKLYGKLIYCTAYSVCHNKCSAESVRNKVLIKIWQKAEELTNIDNPEGWIYVTAKNFAKDEISEGRFVKLDENICCGKDYINEFLDDDSFSFLISDLKDEEQEIMILKFAQGYIFREISEILNKPEAAIMSTFYRSLDKIKQKLTKN